MIESFFEYLNTSKIWLVLFIALVIILKDTEGKSMNDDQNQMYYNPQPDQQIVPQYNSQPTSQMPPAYPGQQMPPTAPMQPEQNLHMSGLAIAGLVLGIVGVATSFIPVANNVSFFLGLIGVVLAIVGLVGINKGKSKGRGYAIAGIILNILTVIFVLASQAFYVSVLDSASNSMRATPASSSAIQQSASANTNANVSNSASSSSAMATATTTNNDSAFVVSIDGANVTADRYGTRVVAITYTYTNNSDKTQSFGGSIRTKAFQNGVELSSAYYAGDNWDDENEYKDVKTGATITVQDAFELIDNSPVTIEAKEMWDWSGAILAEKTFAIE